ncbi:CinA family protein [Leucobacter zeae]|nr:CinA family protein [Leucobacter zeae]
MASSALTEDVDRLVARVAARAQASARSVAVAESLTGGQLATALSSGDGSGEWFRGGIVAYHPEVKYDLLRAPHGPVVTPETATAMAHACRRLLGADCAVALTGVGGPGPEEGRPAGTVFLASAGTDGDGSVAGFRFDGDPIAVIEQSIIAALTALVAELEQPDA